MTKKAPEFWYNPTKEIPFGLESAAKIYGFISHLKINKPPLYTAARPVLCVGNITAGGAGKTPVVQALVKILNEHGKQPAILMRGYGGHVKKPTWVTGQTAKQVGDEALLHVAFAPTMISPDRVRGAQLIEKNTSITHIVMDDGLQNPSLKKTLSFLVMDGKDPIGNGRLLPAGPLREPLETAIKRSDALVIMGADPQNLALQYAFVMPVFQAQVTPVIPNKYNGLGVIAFAGIGKPEKFFTTLEENGAILFDRITFPDHHIYTERELKELVLKGQKANLPLVTTRKDWVRLPSALQARVEVFDVALTWQDPAAVDLFLRDKGML